jgi:mxaK protein
MPRRHSRILLVTAVLLLVLLVFEALRLSQASRFNAALRQQDWTVASRHRGDEARVAKALMLQTSGDWQEAVEIYGELALTGKRRLTQIARYNMANLYLRRGIETTEAGSLDVALPLIELAKTSYRAVLRADPNHWDARFNLATALRIVPDLDLEKVEEEVMPERSQRSLVPLDARRELP